jgi:glutamine amidotransferase
MAFQNPIKRVCILDYGSGNVASVKNAFDRLEVLNKVSNEISDLSEATHLVLPGVGAFGTSMEKMLATLPIDFMINQIEKGKPFLGICVGMQVLAQEGFEYGVHKGLGLLLDSKVIELPQNVAKPHVGWNSITIEKHHDILNGISNSSDFYFVHSYFMKDVPIDSQIASCNYGLTFPAVVGKDNLIGVQFHPEKSQSNGEKLLRNFIEI